MGTRNVDKEPTHRHHGSHRRPNGVDERRKVRFDDGGMGDFVDSLEGMKTGTRLHSTVSSGNNKGKTKPIDDFEEVQEAQDKKSPHKDHRHGGHRQGGHRHKEYALEDRKHSDHGHKKHQHGDHGHKDHPEGDQQHKKHQHEDLRHKEYPEGEHRHKEHQHKDHRPKERPEGDHRHKEHPEGEHRQKEHRKGHHITEKEFNHKMYELALLPFRENSGSPYRCKQSEIDFHRRGIFETPNKGPFVSRMEATEEVLRWNDEKRAPPREELEIIRRLAIAVHDAENNALFSPDIVVKAFADLDQIFFGGRLRGNVFVQWAKQIDPNRKGGILGQTGDIRTGQCRITLNAELLLLQRWSKAGKNPVASTFGTLLHEMCHAYDLVRCPKNRNGGDHDKYWQTMIGVVHDRCCRILGTWAIEYWEREKYQQRYFLPEEGKKSRKEGYGVGNDGGKKHTGEERKVAGEKVLQTWRTHKGTDCVVM